MSCLTEKEALQSGDQAVGIAALLSKRGIDILAPVSVTKYNATVATEYKIELPAGTTDVEMLVLGNTHVLWEPFIASLVQDAMQSPGGFDSWSLSAAPLDDYVATVVNEVFGSDADVRFSQDMEPGRRFCARTAAVEAGLGAVDPDTQLLVHTTFGPWISIRAVVLVELVAGRGAIELRSGKGKSRGALAAIAGAPGDALGSSSWKSLVAARDSVGVTEGKHPFRHSDEQIEYHYTWNPSVLLRAVSQAVGCRKAVVDSLRQCLKRIPPGEKTAILLSGGVDSSALLQAIQEAGGQISENVINVAITVSVGEGGCDLAHAKSVMNSISDVQHVVLAVRIEDLLDEIGWVARVLESFDPMELRNAVVIGMAMKHAATTLGCKHVVTGDGADELFAGYTFTHKMSEDAFAQQRGTMIANMSFSAQAMGRLLGIQVLQPYLESSVMRFASTCTRADLIGCVIEYDANVAHSATMGKVALRRAFPECTTAWRKKVPIESGSGSTRLRLGYFEAIMSADELQAAIQNATAEHNVTLRDREHAHYFAKLLEMIGGRLEALTLRKRHQEYACTSCGFSVGSESQLFCCTCGAYPSK